MNEIPKEVKWMRAAEHYGGNFISSFVTCFRRADAVNQQILESALQEFIKKYPEYLEEKFQAIFVDEF